jgi:hypothetical protein
MALKKDQRMIGYASKISVNRGTGFQAMSSAYQTSAKEFEQLTNAFAQQALSEIKTRGKKVGKEAAENVKFVNEKFMLDENEPSEFVNIRKPVESFTPRTRSEQEAYEKELQQRYVLEATKNGQMIISQAERVNIADNSSPSTFEQTVGPQIQTLLDQLPNDVSTLVDTYLMQDRHQSFLRVYNNYDRVQKSLSDALAKTNYNSYIAKEVPMYDSREEMLADFDNQAFMNSVYGNTNRQELRNKAIMEYDYLQNLSKINPNGIPFNEMSLNQLTSYKKDIAVLLQYYQNTTGLLKDIELSNGAILKSGDIEVLDISKATNIRQRLNNLSTIAGNMESMKSTSALILDAIKTNPEAYPQKEVAKIFTNAGYKNDDATKAFIENDLADNNPSLVDQIRLSDGNLNLRDPKYINYTLERFGVVPDDAVAEITNIVLNNSDINRLRGYISGGLTNVLFEDRELQNGKSIPIDRTETNLNQDVINKLKWIHTKMSVGTSLDSALQSYGSFQEKSEDQAYFGIERIVRDYGRYDSTNELREEFTKYFNKALLKQTNLSSNSFVASAAVYRAFEEQAFLDARLGALGLDSDESIEVYANNFVTNLLNPYSTSIYGASQLHWDQNDISMFLNRDDFKTKMNTLAKFPFEKYGAVNGDIDWALKKITPMLKNGKNLGAVVNRDDFNLGERVRMFAIDNTVPPIYQFVYIDGDNGFVEIVDDVGVPIYWDTGVENPKHKEQLEKKVLSSMMYSDVLPARE